MALELLGVTHRYGRETALRDVTLRVRDGDCYGFIGHNGAGKTTALRVALGLVKPQAGLVRIDGFDAARDPLEARVRMGGLVEAPGFFDSWSGRRNLYLLARLQGIARGPAKREAGALLERVGLAAARAKSVRAYSQGMRQRLGIAQALLGNPSYLLLDEPTNGLDPEGIAELRELIFRLTREEKLTVVLSSHQLNEVQGLCNRIGVLKEGRLLLEAESETLFERAHSRYSLEAGDPARVRAVLAALGVSVERETPGEILLSLDGKDPAQVSRAIVEAGLPLASFARRPPTLEEIYLSLEEPEGPPAPLPETAQGERRAPRLGLFRSLAYETRRLAGGLAAPILLLVPAAAGVAAVLQQKAPAAKAAGEVASKTLESTTAVTAFEAVAHGLSAALPLAALFACGLASQSLAGELSRGTLRNALLRPVRRIQLGAGKLLALGGYTLALYVVALGAVLLAAGACFDFTGVFEILPNGLHYEFGSKAELWAALEHALPAPLLPLLVYCALGFCAGAVVRGAASALGLALGAFVAVDLGRALARSFQAESYLPAAHLPSPLGDTSFLRHYGDVAQGFSNAHPTFSELPLVFWLAALILVSFLVLARRQIP